MNFHSKCKILGGVTEFFGKAFLAVFYPATFPGRLFIRYTPFQYKPRWVTVEKLVFFGKFSLKRPFVFSSDPFCQELGGSAK